MQVDRKVLEEAIAALEDACGGRCNAEYNPCWQQEVAQTLKAALEQPNEDYERGFVDGMSEQAKRSVDRAVNHMADALEQPVAWVITEKNINSLQVTSIQRLIDRLKHAHHTDLRVRINGQDEWFQADWIKHLQRTHPPRKQEPLCK
jgi:hypothetical protein